MVPRSADGPAEANPEKEDGGNAVSVIGPDIVITGNIEPAAEVKAVDLHIEGQVNGDIRCSTLILGEGSSVRGNINVDRVRVSGSVEGSILTRDLAVEASARVAGEIVYERLRIASGAIVEGTLKVRTGEEVAAPSGKLTLVEQRVEAKPKAIYIE